MKKEKIPFLVGERIILRPINEETDLESCYKWINSPEIRHYINSGRFPVSLESEREFLKIKPEKPPKDIVFAIAMKETGKIIGLMGLHHIDWVSRHCNTGAMIGEKSNRGKGYGSEAKMLLLEYAFETLNLNRIESCAIAYNEASVAYSQKCGYKTEGLLRKAYFHKGQYHDTVILSILQSDWFKNKKKKTKK